jgi:hypothetical protein
MNQSVRYKINAPHIVHEIFEDQEAAIINLKSGNYYSLDPVGAYIWAQIESAGTLDEVVAQVMNRYEGPMIDITNEVNKFVDALQAEDLIVAAIDAPSDYSAQRVRTDGIGNGGKIAFTAPVVERYNDMQELLLLDPIHEVDETGWPHRKRED